MLVKYFSNINNIKFVPALVLLLILYIPNAYEFEHLKVPEIFTEHVNLILLIPTALYIIYYILSLFFIGFRLHYHKLLEYPSHIHALFAGMLFAIVVQPEHLTFIQIVAYTLILYMMLISLNLPVITNKPYQFFKLSFAAGLLVFFDIRLIFFILYPFVVMITFREISIKNVLSIFNGVLLPLMFYVAGNLLLFGTFDFSFFAHLFQSITCITLNSEVFSWFFSVVLTLYALSIFRFIFTSSRHKILFRKHTVNMIWASLLSLWIMITDLKQEQQSAYMTFSLVTGYLFAYVFSSLKTARIRKLLYQSITITYVIVLIYVFLKIV